MIQSELIASVQEQVKGLSSEFETADYNNAYARACTDTGFACPTTVQFEIDWLGNRTIRWLMWFLYNQAVTAFDVPKAKLNQTFTNLKERIKELDEEFLAAQMEFADEFGLTGGFGTVVGSGFINDRFTGEDLSYDVENNVLINGK